MDKKIDSLEKETKNCILYSKNIRKSLFPTQENPGNRNTLVIGGTGTGKTQSFVRPNLLQMNGSFVLTDPHEENVRELAPILKENGYIVKILNLRTLNDSHKYNPFRYLRCELDVWMLIRAIVEEAEKKRPNYLFFSESEKYLLSAGIYFVMEQYKEEERNFSELFELLGNCEKELDAMFTALSDSSLAKKYYQAFVKSAGVFRESITNSVIERLRSFLRSDIAEITEKDEMNLEKIGFEKTAVFVIPPSADVSYHFLTQIFYNQLLESLHVAGEKWQEKTGSSKLPIHVMVFMDELANHGKILELSNNLSTSIFINVSIHLIVQSIGQLEQIYGPEWKSITQYGCSNILYMGGTNDIESMLFISEIAGLKNIRLSSNKKEESNEKILTEKDIQKLNIDECIVCTPGSGLAVIDKKIL